MMQSLKNHIAVVTGASSGIGKSIALELAKKEAILCLLGRNLGTLQEVADQARKATDRVECYQVDLFQDQEITDFGRSISEEFKGVDILVHCAGVYAAGALESASIADFDWHYKINVRGPYLLTQVLLKSLKARKGDIVFINTSAVLKANARLSQYASTKQALKAVADSLRQEINAEGIRVLSVYPGRTASPMQAAIFEAEGRDYKPELLIQPQDLATLITGTLCLPRSMEVTDIYLRPMLNAKQIFK
jgi:NADP-dependent 3-hydroxy acid dehydrogenase YdfG